MTAARTVLGIRWIDDVGESPVEVEEVDIVAARSIQLLREVAVVEQCGQVAAAHAFGVVGRPGLPRRAGQRVQVVDEDPGHAQLPQPLHAPGDLTCHVPDEVEDLALAAHVGDARVVVAGDGHQRDRLPELPFPDVAAIKNLLEGVDLLGQGRRLAWHLEHAGATHGEVHAELVAIILFRVPVRLGGHGAPKNLCCNTMTTNRVIQID